jgi:hypothetical protein
MHQKFRTEGADKRTYERWGLKDGEGKLRTKTSGGE